LIFCFDFLGGGKQVKCLFRQNKEGRRRAVGRKMKWKVTILETRMQVSRCGQIKNRKRISKRKEKNSKKETTETRQKTISDFPYKSALEDEKTFKQL
jgi:hypothetical protein